MRGVIALAALCGVLWADEPRLADDPDIEVSRRHFEEGARLYAAGKYEEAIVRFERARAAKALPALDFNIARAYDRLDRCDEALAAYRRYLQADPADADTVRVRVKLLEQRCSGGKPAAVAVSPPPAKKKPRTWVYIVAGTAALAVAGVAIGLGVGLGLPSDPRAQLGALHW